MGGKKTSGKKKRSVCMESGDLSDDGATSSRCTPQESSSGGSLHRDNRPAMLQDGEHLSTSVSPALAGDASRRPTGLSSLVRVNSDGLYGTGNEHNELLAEGIDGIRSSTTVHDYPMMEDRSDQVTMVHMRKPNVMPSHFDGTGSWPDYLVHFEVCAQINGWRDVHKAAYLAVSLRGLAQQMLGDLTAVTRTSYDGLSTALAKRFDPSNQVKLYRVQLRSRVLGSGETLPELGQAIRRLTGRAYPGANYQLIDTLSRDHFIDALPDSDMRLRIYQAKPVTLDDAVCTAVELDAFQRAEQQRLRYRKPAMSLNAVFSDGDDRVDKLSKTIDAFSTQLEKLAGVVDSIEKRTEIMAERNRPRNRGVIVCFRCGNQGHISTSRECPRRPGASRTNHRSQSSSPESGNY
jgi:hypothetical protein